jgi:ATP-dependent DNA helicase RecQ
MDLNPSCETGSRLGQVERVLRSVWGYSALRQPQRRAVLAALSGRDALVVLPTGGGKSLCYQVPALALPGLTLVVSPLISLMQDQVAALRRRGVAAAYLSSAQPATVRARVRAAVRAGGLRLLYVAPERLAELPRLLRGRPLSLLAVDEAHCISEWGHDFRPHYRRIGRWRAALGRPPTIALTATATPATRQDILRVLGLTRPVLVTASFDRPNLFLGARRLAGEPERFAALEARLAAVPGCAIVYVPTRNRADGIAKVLRWRGTAAAPYHAGLPPAARRALLRRFLDGAVRVMVATSAFGMGIDKPDVRLVAHLGVPARPEAYYQEAGRAGRDDRPARCELLWCDHDLERAGHPGRAAAPPGSGGAAAPWAAAARHGLETMHRYVTTTHCRRRVLLGYLGEKMGRCTGCDRCGNREW